MKGHLIERSPGKWAIVLDVKDPATGKRRRKWHSFSGTKREAQKRCAELITEIGQGAYIEPSKQTVARYFEAWLRDWAPLKAGPKTLERYWSLAGHVTTAIGTKSLQQTRGSDLARIYRDMAAKGLSPRTIKHVHVLTRGIFRQAMKLGDVKVDPTTQIGAPAVPPKEAAVLRVEEIPVMLAAVRGTALYPIAIVALGTGMRRGELCGLRWIDADLDAGRLEVKQSVEQIRGRALRFKEPKTARSRRSISLALSVVAALREHRKNQLEQRLAFGLGKPPADGLVFTTLDGNPRSPNDIGQRFSVAMTAAGLPHVSLHTLRHTHASILIREGVDILTISRRLGHSSAAITLGVYGHLVSSQDRAADIIEGVLLGG
ncbi:MAG TPA: site-specific integrase [Xanthobacteraceae bacterium]